MTTPSRPKQSLSLRVKLTLRLLEKIKHGTLRLTLPDGQTMQFGKDQGQWLAAELHIKDVAMFEAVLELGDIGFGETYMEGLWDSPDLGALMQLLAANRQSLEKVVYGHWWSGLWQRLRHALNRNTRAGSRRNIAAHYDLGNDFYELWLDPSMTYSSALFKGNFNQTLQEAQMAKCHHALSSAGVRPGSRVLEVGCGWGGLAALSIEHFGAYHTGITLSREQLEWVKAHQAESHDSGRLQLQFRDYRELLAPDEAPYDAIVSIEMFEAVGQAYWEAYMAMLARSLRIGGKACIQTITIDEALFERYASGTDFIQKHVFPGGMLPSAKRFVEHAQKAGLELVDHLAFGQDYAETLRRWRHSFEACLDKVRAQGYDERFIRLWRFYLTYCEAGFDQGSLNVEQFTLCHAQAS